MSTNLFLAIEQHDMKQLAELLLGNVEVDSGKPERPDWSPLMSAVDEVDEGGPIEAVVLLLRHGASVNVNDIQPSMTPLIVAVLNKQLDVARLLLAAGANPNVRTDEGDSPLRLSVDQNDRAMATLLLLCGADKTIDSWGMPGSMTALGRAAWMLNVPMIELLMNAGANVNQLDGNYRTASDRMPPRENGDPQLWDNVKLILTHPPHLGVREDDTKLK